MADEFRILNWNVAGAKLLEIEDPTKRDEFRNNVNDSLVGTIKSLGKNAPHVITLQEIIQYKIPGQKLVDFIDESKFPEYTYLSFPLVDTRRHSYTSKWKKLYKDKKWDPNTFFAQGNAIMSRKDLPILPVWSLANSSRGYQIKGNSESGNRRRRKPHLVEKVGIESGIYFGDRNTEPRSALVSHFVFDDEFHVDKETKKRIPQDVFVVNLHLTTLTNEREGIPEIDDEATKIRLKQLDVVFSGIISRYNMWAKSGFLTRTDLPVLADNETIKRYKPLWILCGDFNFTPDGDEYQYIQRRNFVDVLKGLGPTKASGYDNAASLTLDYIFAGPKFISYDEVRIGSKVAGDIDQKIMCSDHRPMYARIPLGYK
jgi:hypothetical protein